MGLLCWLLLASCLTTSAADVSVTQKGDLYTLDNALMSVTVDSAGGARIKSWTLKPSSRDLIALWKGANEIGGALDDRAFFTAMRYEAAIMQPGPEVGVLRLEAAHPSGLSVLKILTLRRDSPALHVSYEWRNGTQAPQRMFIRNFILPGTRPQTDEHVYWVNADEPVAGSPEAHGYYVPAKPEFAAMWDRVTGDGMLAFVPGVSKFYFWRGSKEFPTFEWLHEDIPAGKILRANALLLSVSEHTDVPDWEALIADNANAVRAASLVDLPGWVDEATSFEVTGAERERGFWLSIGEGEGKQRLPGALPVDLPRDGTRHVGVSLNVLKDLRAELKVQVPEAWQNAVSVFRETPGQDKKELLPIPQGVLPMDAGTRESIWLRVSADGIQPGEHRVPLTLSVGDASAQMNIALRVWPVDEPTQRPFHVRGYCGGFPVWGGGYEIDEQRLRVLDAILTAFADMGGDVFDWNAVWAQILAHVKIEGTGDILPQVAKARPESLDLENLPRLDFSYYDPWFEAAKRHGVTRLEAYMMHPAGDQWSWRLLTPAVGAGRAEPGTPEAEKVLLWYYGEMRRYLADKGFDGFFCKISDEISPEHIPPHIETAKVVQKAGWRPFTTITGMIARTSAHIREMDPYCDQWQLSFGLKDDFLALLSTKMKLVEETFELSGPWGHYTNGGAVDTWAMRVFGDNGAVNIDPGQIEQFELLEDGRALRIVGDSPWGNKEHGVVITAGSLKQHLYVSAFDGGNPAGHKYTLKVMVRRPAEDGEPLVRIDDTDEVWCYGGGSSPFKAPYHSGYNYPLMTLYHGFDGYGQWAFYHWNKTERVIWVDAETAEVTVSPVYCGYRDGYHDALLLNALIEKAGRAAFDRIVGEDESAALRVGKRSHEVYNFRTLLNADDPLAINEARRRALQGLAGR